MYAASLTIILVVICEAAFPTISNAGLIAMGIIAFVVLLIFIAYEMWVPAPLIQFRLLGRRSILLPLLGNIHFLKIEITCQVVPLPLLQEHWLPSLLSFISKDLMVKTHSKLVLVNYLSVLDF